jgi:hypothetical protein
MAFRGDKAGSHCHGEISFRSKNGDARPGLRICNVPRSSMILYGSTTASPARLGFAKGKADRIPVYGGADESREIASFTTKILCAL